MLTVLCSVYTVYTTICPCPTLRIASDHKAIQVLLDNNQAMSAVKLANAVNLHGKVECSESS